MSSVKPLPSPFNGQPRVVQQQLGHPGQVWLPRSWARAGLLGAATAVAGRLWATSKPTLPEQDRPYLIDWVAEEIGRLGASDYANLLSDVDSARHCLGRTPSGVEVMRETMVFRDDPHSGNLRVVVAAWMPSTGGSSLVSKHFVRAPDGTFVRE